MAPGTVSTRRTWRGGALLVALSTLWAATGWCQTTDAPAAPAGQGEASPERIAYRAARVIRVGEPDVAPGTILVDEGRIEEVLGEGESVPAGVSVVDLGKNSVVLPVLVNPLSQIHTVGSTVRGRRGGMISSGGGSPTDGRRRKASTSVRADQEIYERLERLGYGIVTLAPARADLISGRVAVVRARSAEKKEELILVEDGYIYLGYDRGKSWRLAAEKSLKKAAEMARDRKKGKPPAAAQKTAPAARPAPPGARPPGGRPAPTPPPKPSPTPPGPTTPPQAPAKTPAGPPKPPPPPDALEEIFHGKRKALLHVASPAALDHFFRFLDTLPEKFRFVLVTPPVEKEIVTRLASQRRQAIEGVILEARLSTFTDTSVYYNGARLFHEAGIPVALIPTTDDLRGHEEIFFYLAELIKTGLDPRTALEAVTINPARILGLDDRFGAIAPGKEASFVVYDGDPLSGSPRVLRVYREGELSSSPADGEGGDPERVARPAARGSE